MKRVETININGIVFSIDDDAYGKLGSYLETLSGYFKNEQGGREIIADIEARIAELFAERDGGTAQIVTIEDVARVIETLGTPEDIAGADTDTPTESEKKTPHRKPQQEKSTRRLYRDPDRRYLGGVCAGIAAWLGINPAIIRLIFIVFVFFPFFSFTPIHSVSAMVYVLLWIIIPKAKTTTQKLEMRGEPVNISNIEKNIKETLSDSSFKHSFRNFLNEVGEFFGKILGVIWRIFTIILGLILCCEGIALCMILFCLFFMQDVIFNHAVEWDFLSFNELFQHIISPASYIILVTCATVIFALLTFALLFWGIKFITGFKIKHKMLHVALAILWIVAIITGIVTCFTEFRHHAWRNEQMVEIKQIAPADTLYLSATASPMQISNNPMDIYYDKDSRCFYGKPSLRVRKSDDGQIKLRFSRESQGESKRAAYQYAENIAYHVEIRDSLLAFDQYFTVIPQDKWKFQTLDLVLYVPEGTVIVGDKSWCDKLTFGPRLRWYVNANHNCTWIMTEKDGLQPLIDKE